MFVSVSVDIHVGQALQLYLCSSAFLLTLMRVCMHGNISRVIAVLTTVLDHFIYVIYLTKLYTVHS